MNQQVAVLATIVVGGLVALQAPINSVLGKTTGNLAAASVNFFIGTVALVALVAVLGQLGRVGDAIGLPWYYVVGGGIMGALYVTTVLVTVRSLGAGGVTAATITGQLAASLILDRFGLLGLPEVAITPERVIGVALLLAGTLLIVR